VPAGHAADPRRFRFETADPERGGDYLSRAYGAQVRIGDGHGPYWLRHDRYGPGSFYIDTLSQAVTTEYEVDPIGSLVAIRMRSGIRTGLGDGSGTGQVGPGGMAVHGQPDQPGRVRLQPAVVTAVVVDTMVAAETVRNSPDDEPGPLLFTALSPRSPAAARNWQYTVDYVTDMVLHNRAMVGSPLVTGSIARLLAATLLATFPNTWVPEPGTRDDAGATPGTLHRAIDFIEANADLDVSVTDIARAAGTTSRTVQLSFRRHLDTTPMAYLRGVRLERAHRQLRSLGPDDGVSVTEVAARWGFASPSRFGRYYRAAYGVTPGHTLRG
jgi:AraC-like DNA-binding protein